VDILTQSRKLDVLWNAIVGGEVDGPCVSHVGEVQFVHAPLTLVGDVAVLVTVPDILQCKN
jgi:hypothetical protein